MTTTLAALDTEVVCPARQPALVNRDGGSCRVPCLLGAGVADRGRPVAVDGSEHASRPQEAGDLGERGLGLHPVQRLHGEDHIGAAVVQIGGTGEAGTYRTLVGGRSAAAARTRMSSFGSTPTTSDDHVAAQRLDNPVPLPRSTTISGRPPAYSAITSASTIGGTGRTASYRSAKPENR